MDEPGGRDGQHPCDIVARHATLADLDDLVPAFSAAVRDEAVASWMLPDEERRRHLADTAGFGQYVRGLLQDGVLVVAETDGIAGVSVISAPTLNVPTTDPGYSRCFASPLETRWSDLGFLALP